MQDMTFINTLRQYNIEPSKYLRIVRQNAKRNKYDSTKLQFSDKEQYKLMIYDKTNNKYVYFGDSNYKDYIIYSLLDGQQKADKRRYLYLNRALNIRGDWSDNRFSKNNLAITILWSGN